MLYEGKRVFGGRDGRNWWVIAGEIRRYRAIHRTHQKCDLNTVHIIQSQL